jgi:hypothetical protein
VDLRRACIGLLFLLASGCGSVSAPRGGAGGGAGTGSGGSADAAAGGAGAEGGSTGAGGTTGTGGSTITDAGVDQGGGDLAPNTAIWDQAASLWDDHVWGP